MLEKALRSTIVVVVATGMAVASGIYVVGIPAAGAATAAASSTSNATGAAPETTDAARTLAQAAPQAAESATIIEVEQAVIEYFRYMRENSKSRPAAYSGLGSLEFWSSGGLVMEVPPEGLEEEFELFNLHPKHITVLELVPDQAAAAVFYAEGSLQPKGGAFVARYLTRVTQIFVKEQGQWRIRSSHWSPLVGGAGTNQVSVEQ